jgi:hypothetical protein
MLKLLSMSKARAFADELDVPYQGVNNPVSIIRDSDLSVREFPVFGNAAIGVWGALLLDKSGLIQRIRPNTVSAIAVSPGLKAKPKLLAELSHRPRLFLLGMSQRDVFLLGDTENLLSVNLATGTTRSYSSRVVIGEKHTLFTESGLWYVAYAKNGAHSLAFCNGNSCDVFSFDGPVPSGRVVTLLRGDTKRITVAWSNYFGDSRPMTSIYTWKISGTKLKIESEATVPFALEADFFGKRLLIDSAGVLGVGPDGILRRIKPKPVSP